MKAIMIVDIPDNCNKSLLSKTPASITFNHGTYKTLLYVEGYLKPIPQRRNSLMCGDSDGNKWIEPSEYDIGYNACIEEILGDE